LNNNSIFINIIIQSRRHLGGKMKKAWMLMLLAMLMMTAGCFKSPTSPSTKPTATPTPWAGIGVHPTATPSINGTPGRTPTPGISHTPGITPTATTASHTIEYDVTSSAGNFVVMYIGTDYLAHDVSVTGTSWSSGPVTKYTNDLCNLTILSGGTSMTVTGTIKNNNVVVAHQDNVAIGGATSCIVQYIVK
jgi:hypothetical protein